MFVRLSAYSYIARVPNLFDTVGSIQILTQDDGITIKWLPQDTRATHTRKLKYSGEEAQF